MQPTYPQLLDLQNMYLQHRYDHAHPTPQHLQDAHTLLATSLTAEEQLTARAYGEHVGAWYWNNELQQWVSPPRKVWTDV